jgi:hypothetical protein
MTELILGSDLLKKYSIKPPELFICIQRGELSPRTWVNGIVCRPDRKPTPYVEQLKSRIESLKLKRSELQCKDDLLLDIYSNEPFPALKIKQIEDEIDAIEAELKSVKKGHPSPYDWKNYSLPENKSDAIALMQFLCNCFYLDDEVANVNNGIGFKSTHNQESCPVDNSNRKNLLPSQRHRIAVRKVAKALWEQDPTITIADMAYLDAINLVCEGKVYKEKTIRNWIKDDCPNRAPGRRPNVKKR